MPDLSQPALINNGGEAQADAGTAPGNMQAFSIEVGTDGDSGSLTSEGVDLESLSSLLIGVIRPDHIGGGTASGQVILRNASYITVDSQFPKQGGENLQSLNVGTAYTTGVGVGRLEIENADLIIGSRGIRTGYAQTEPPDNGATAVADGTLELRNMTITADDSSLCGCPGLRPTLRVPSPTATAELILQDLVLDGFFSLGEVEADGLNSTASATGSATSDGHHRK